MCARNWWAHLVTAAAVASGSSSAFTCKDLLQIPADESEERGDGDMRQREEFVMRLGWTCSMLTLTSLAKGQVSGLAGPVTWNYNQTSGTVSIKNVQWLRGYRCIVPSPQKASAPGWCLQQHIDDVTKKRAANVDVMSLVKGMATQEYPVQTPSSADSCSCFACCILKRSCTRELQQMARICILKSFWFVTECPIHNKIAVIKVSAALHNQCCSSGLQALMICTVSIRSERAFLVAWKQLNASFLYFMIALIWWLGYISIDQGLISGTHSWRSHRTQRMKPQHGRSLNTVWTMLRTSFWSRYKQVCMLQLSDGV